MRFIEFGVVNLVFINRVLIRLCSFFFCFFKKEIILDFRFRCFILYVDYLLIWNYIVSVFF